MKGIVFNVQRHSLTDGPGIRTIVFLKGCSMHCLWCENPESIEPNPRLSFNGRLCIQCGTCETICPLNAIDITRSQRVEWERCSDCGACADTCPSLALKMIGEEMTVSQVLAIVLQDRAFYERSGGGVTISGGEPTFQYEFLLALLQSFRQEGLDVVLETNGLLPWQRLERLARYVDTFYLDIKGVDATRHREQTGAGNQLILRNAERLVTHGYHVVFRIPMIPSYTISADQLERIGKFLDDVGATEIHLLPYHRLGEGKLARPVRSRVLASISEMSRSEAEQLGACFQKGERRVFVGGS